jgi:hypothetical protein
MAVLRAWCLIALMSSAAFAGELPGKERKALERTLKQSSDPEARASAARSLAMDDSKRAVQVLLSVGAASESAALDHAVRAGLAGVESPEAVKALLKPLEKRKNLKATLLALDACGLRKDAASAEALGAALEDPRPEVLRTALHGIERRKPEQAVEGLFAFLERIGDGAETPALIERTARAALTAITGRHYDVVADWRKYWEIRQEQGGRAAAKAGPKGSSERAMGSQAPKFFGSEVRSDRVVFVLDASLSMQGRKIAKAKQELVGAIEGLTPRSRFTVVAFARGNKLWKRELTAATDAHKADCKAWIESLELWLGTDTLTALQAAFQIEGADAIVLLTDGRPTDKGPDGKRLGGDAFLDEAMKLNRWTRWRIDAFGLLGGRRKKAKPGAPPPDEAPERLLRSLARLSGGTFSKVRAGGGKRKRPGGGAAQNRAGGRR